MDHTGKLVYWCPVCQDKEYERSEDVEAHAFRLFREKQGTPDDVEMHRQIARNAGYKSARKK